MAAFLKQLGGMSPHQHDPFVLFDQPRRGLLFGFREAFVADLGLAPLRGYSPRLYASAPPGPRLSLW